VNHPEIARQMRLSQSAMRTQFQKNFATPDAGARERETSAAQAEVASNLRSARRLGVLSLDHEKQYLRWMLDSQQPSWFGGCGLRYLNFGHLLIVLSAQSDFDVGLIQPALRIPRNPTY
jgi:hypothetical protein